MGITDKVAEVKKEGAVAVQEQAPKKVFNQYFSSRPMISIIMPSGRKLSFVGGRLVTDEEEVIGFLDSQIKSKHPMIFTRTGEEKIEDATLDPLAALRAKFFAEFQEAQKAAVDPSNDMGNTTAQVSKAANVGAATSRSISSMAAQVSSPNLGTK